MTIKELKKLTPEQKRILIAHLCGWRQRPPEMHSQRLIRGLIGPNGESELPDYLNNMEVMDAAIHSLNLDQYEAFNKALYKILHGNFVNATTVQRADAFLLAVG